MTEMSEANVPVMPYTVELRPYGADGRLLPTKIRPDGFNALLTEEEQEVNAYLLSLVAECQKLRDFKTYVHKRLDAAGVPVDPDGPHKAIGCRIGGRLDLVLEGYVPPDSGPGIGSSVFIPHEDEPQPAEAKHPKSRGRR